MRNNPIALLVATMVLTSLVSCHDPEPQKQPQVAPVPALTASEVPIEIVATPPPKPVEKLLYEFSTKFKAGPKYVGRVTNISKLAQMLDNTRIIPGGEFSFNKVAGPRTKKEGYKEAPTYFLGEIIPGVGGGSCQVSSTMYAAALHANVEVTDRRPHSRASSYIPPGLDATVNYPQQCWDAKKPDQRICYDLKFKNPYDFDLLFRFEISAEIEKKDPKDENGKKTLTISVWGTGKIPEVTTKWAGYGAPPFKVRYRRVSYWQNTRKKLSQSGKPGLRGARLLTIEHLDGKVEKKSIHSKYNPVSQVYMVGMEFEKPKPKEEANDAP